MFSENLEELLNILQNELNLSSNSLQRERLFSCLEREKPFFFRTNKGEFFTLHTEKKLSLESSSFQRRDLREVYRVLEKLNPKEKENVRSSVLRENTSNHEILPYAPGTLTLHLRGEEFQEGVEEVDPHFGLFMVDWEVPHLRRETSVEVRSLNVKREVKRPPKMN